MKKLCYSGAGGVSNPGAGRRGAGCQVGPEASKLKVKPFIFDRTIPGSWPCLGHPPGVARCGKIQSCPLLAKGRGYRHGGGCGRRGFGSQGAHPHGTGF